MQPTYLPWAGYFNLIYRSDHFVFLDDVKVEKSSWHVRNRVLENGNVVFLTLNIKGSRLNLINEVIIDENSQWRKKHIIRLRQAYAKTQYGNSVIELLSPIYEDKNIVSLSQLNQTIIKSIMVRLGIDTKVYLSSELNIDGKRSERLLAICNHFSETHYLSPEGSRDYITEDGVLEENKITVEYQSYTPAIYSQYRTSEFFSHLSIIDVISNIGWEKTFDYIKG
ncbi:WbqC family protein [Leptospira levettii]|nr:WbqC family protein [Leptospira levettii]